MNTVTPLSHDELNAFEADCHAVLRERVFAPFGQSFTPSMLRSAHIGQHRLVVATQAKYAELPNIVTRSGHLVPHACDMLVHSPSKGEQALKEWMRAGQTERAQNLTQFLQQDTHTNVDFHAHELQDQHRFLLHRTCHTCGGSGAVPCARCEATGLVTCPRCEGKKEITCSRCDGTGQLTCSECGGTTRVRCAHCFGGQVSCTYCGGSGGVYSSYENQTVSCGYCYGSGRQRCSYCSGTGNQSCTSCYNGSVTCSRCRGSGIVTCPECSGSGDITCPDCSGTRKIPCATCSGTGKLSTIWECLYDIHLRSEVCFEDAFPVNIAAHIRGAIQNNSFCQLCVDSSTPYSTVFKAEEFGEVQRYFGTVVPIGVFTIEFLEQPLECSLFGRTVAVLDMESLHKSMMQRLLRPTREFLDAGKWLLPFGWSHSTACLHALLRIPLIREQMQQATLTCDWTGPAYTLVARMRRVFRLAAVLPAVMGAFLPTDTSREMARVCVERLAKATGWAWESLCSGGGVLVEKTVQGLFWLDRSMAETVVKTVETEGASMMQGLSQHAPVWDAVAAGWNQLTTLLAQPFCTWLLVWGVLLPSAALFGTRIVFYGWKGVIGGKLFQTWCNARLPADKSALVYICGLSSILLFACYCLRWLGEVCHGEVG